MAGRRIEVQGNVQGVECRHWVWRLAHDCPARLVRDPFGNLVIGEERSPAW